MLCKKRKQKFENIFDLNSNLKFIWMDSNKKQINYKNNQKDKHINILNFMM